MFQVYFGGSDYIFFDKSQFPKKEIQDKSQTPSAEKILDIVTRDAGLKAPHFAVQNTMRQLARECGELWGPNGHKFVGPHYRHPSDFGGP